MGAEMTSLNTEPALPKFAEYLWRGYGKDGEALDSELFLSAREADALWQIEFQRLEGQPLDFKSYQNVAQGFRPLAANAVKRALEWAQNAKKEGEQNEDTENRRVIGEKLITHHLLKSVVSGANRVEEEFKGVEIDYLELIHINLTKAVSKVIADGPSVRENWILPQSSNTLTYNQGIKMVAESLGIQTSWLKDGFPPDIDQGIRDFKQRKGYSASFLEIPSIIAKTPRYRWQVADEKIVFPDAIDPEEETEKRNLTELLTAAFNLHLNDAERVAIVFHSGFFGDEYKSFRKIAQLLSVTPERIRQIEVNGLRKLRFGSNIAPYVDYSERPIYNAEPARIFFNGFVNAMHQKDYQRALANIQKLNDSFLSEFELVDDKGPGIRNSNDLIAMSINPFFLPGRNKYVDEFRRIAQLAYRVSILARRY